MPLSSIKKRSGQLEQFDALKLARSLEFILAAQGLLEQPLPQQFACEVISKLEKEAEKIANITTEDVRNAVAWVLLQNELPEVARFYSLHKDKKLPLEPIQRAGLGLKINRLFTKQGVDPLAEIDYELRTSIIRNADGTVVAEMKDIEVPQSWSQVASDILAQKYIRKAGVPQTDDQGNYLTDAQGKPVLGPEHSVRQIVHRLAGCWRFWGEKYDYFATPEDAQAYEDEMSYMLVHQLGAPNSPQWFNTGLHYAYGITGTPQGHYFVDPLTRDLNQSADAYTHPQPHACFIQSLNDDLVNEGGIFDLVLREARLFKYGSGTGSNFSSLRGAQEKLSGGGRSSGLMSFLRIFDRAAGAVKSGGTTRRAAKMVVVDIDHPDIEEFIEWKMKEEQKVASLVTGSQINSRQLNDIMTTAIAEKTTDWTKSTKVKRAIHAAIIAGAPLNYIERVLRLIDQGYSSLSYPIQDTHFEGEAYSSVAGQNSNNSVRLTNEFMQAVAQGKDWKLIRRTDGQVAKTIPAQQLWDKINYSAWSCADPGLQFHDTANEWHTCSNDGPITASNPCSEYMFLDDTACNLASINLAHFLDEDSGQFQIEKFQHAVRLWTITLEISVLMAQFPSKQMAWNSYLYRTLGLGYANLGTILMTLGIPYDSSPARNIAGAITAIMSGEAYATSAEMAAVLGPFERFPANRETMLQVLRNHRRAAYNATPQEYENLTVKPLGLDPKYTPGDLIAAARECWDRAIALGEVHGYRNAQTTLIAPTGTIGLVMDCDTTGIEPDFAIVKYKKLAGGGYLKIINRSVHKGLKRLNYNPEQIKEIETYALGHNSLKNSPHINNESLNNLGFSDKDLANIETALASAMNLSFVFNASILGEQTLLRLGFTPAEITDPKLNVLQHLGFSPEQIQQANEYIFGTMTLEGAPHLRPENYLVFDCANRCGSGGTRYIPYDAHIMMMAATQPFLSGAISKTINMPHEATIAEVASVHEKSWTHMLKAVALYRDGSKLSQPLNSTTDESSLLQLAMADDVDETVGPKEFQQMAAGRGVQEKLPHQRQGFVQEAIVGGHKVYVRTGEYPDGRLGEIFIDMYKEGAAYRSLVNMFAISISKGLQYGIPLEEYVDTFTYTKFEPAGVIQGHPNIKMATSIMDYVFRLLGFEYLNRIDLVQNKPEDPQPTLPMDLSHTTVTLQTNGHSEHKKVADLDVKDAARQQGFTGDQCGSCGSMKMKRNGSCLLCADCGETTGCS
ncbi:MAG: adenosylcobalamin-dependent ribonucleoside-diphosphate reductase [Candidatus Komeilibacteria bacterium]